MDIETDTAAERASGRSRDLKPVVPHPTWSPDGLQILFALNPVADFKREAAWFCRAGRPTSLI